ncbi:hypothetical protein Q5425_03055 [Amycolatopsis sp. A133]|uniref:hypothetical protein n=1 Tax=Amycolatopsis sp. A133 TaxID=3064472 RepID=UPI0027EBFB51|nr:hypothetical protein [Amycolatopsis sp. A133]MDQ7802693.1 hypothetical protein [Amycolatopsis sp. A133]
MTAAEEDPAVGTAEHRTRKPLLRTVVSVTATERRRLLDRVLPAGLSSLPEDELWMGDGPARPMVLPDLELLCALETEGLDGPIWAELEHRLVGFGLGVLDAWITSGQIYDRATQKGRPVRPPRPPFTRDEQITVVYDAVADGLRLFRTQGIEKGGWCPDRGARLSTYFLGSCVLCFANACRKQLSARRRCDQDVLVPEVEWGSLSPSAERTALASMDVDVALNGTVKLDVPPDVVKLVLQYLIFGYEVTAIPELVDGTSPRIVRRIRHAYRTQIKEQREGGRRG